MRPGWMGQLDGVGGLRSADQPQLQGRDSAKVGITADHHGVRSKLQAASCLQGIGCTQSMQGSHEGGLLNNRSREFDPNQVWLGKNGIERRSPVAFSRQISIDGGLAALIRSRRQAEQPAKRGWLGSGCP